MKYFEVNAKCGHVGKGKCIWILFAVSADSKKQAAQKAREYKRVKHHNKQVIGYVNEISFSQFMELRTKNDSDPYLHCKNIQQQLKIENFEHRVCIDTQEIHKKTKCKEYHRKKTKILEKEFEIRLKESTFKAVSIHG